MDKLKSYKIDVMETKEKVKEEGEKKEEGKLLAFIQIGASSSPV